MARVFMSVGSNINPEENVREAIRRLGRQVRIVGLSTFYRDQAEGRPEQPAFYNGVVEVETEMPAAELKRGVLRRIEQELGRKRTEDKYAPRTIDLDILVYGDLAVTTGDLVIPDPQIPHRPFLAIPLHELAPELVLPGLEVAVREIAARFADHKMEPLKDYTKLLRGDIEHGS